MALHLSRGALTRSRRWWSVAVVAVCWLSLANAAEAATYGVTRTDDPAGAGNCPLDCSLRQAIATSAAGDTIELGAAAYTLTQGTALLVDHSLTIDGAGRADTTIDGSHNRDTQGRPDRILKATAGPLLIRELTFTGGTDGRDENFTSCSPCNTLSANGGGALFNEGASVTVYSVTFDGNAGSPVGGAIANTGFLDMTDVDFHANGAAFGAGLISSGTVTADRVTFRDGSGTRGGAVFMRGGTTTLTNSTVSGNGSSSTVGGGVVNRAGNLSLLNVTLAGNLRGGLETAQGATTSVRNTILATGYRDGTNGSCVGANQNSFQGWTTAAPITNDLGNNLAEDETCGTLTGPASQSQVDPRVAPTTDNAGATPTAALLHGSPALDAGDDAACPSYDHRGVSRADQGPHCDIGAFEAIRLGPPTVGATSAPTVGSFDATLAATINLAGEGGALHFVWGTAPTALTETSETAATGLIATPTQRTVPIYGLQPSTTYYFRAIADNATGTASGSIQSFTTLPGPPVVSNLAVTSVTDTTATIGFSIDPAGADTSYVVAYNGQTTAPVHIGSSSGPQQLTHTLTGLTPGTDYTVDVIATNAGGTQGADSGALPLTTDRRLTEVTGSAVTLTDSGPAAECPASASIDWGDGTPADASGTLTCSDDGHDGFNYELKAAHTYRAAGTFHIQIQYSSGDRGSAWALISTAPAQPTPTSVPTIQPTPTPTATPSPTPTPTFHQTVVVKPVGGTVLVKLKGTSKFVPLTAGQAIPLGSQIDVTKGRITLTSIPKAGGKPETATFYAGIFTVTQSGSITELRLSGPLAPCKPKGKGSAAASKPKTRKLWGDGKGQFRTRGQYSAATIRGTRWLVQDSCAGTLTKVATGVVSVRDTVRGKTVLLRAPRSYLAKPR